MLAQSFKSADELNITEPEFIALVGVLGMLERGELIDVADDARCDNGFNLGTQGYGCGTPACIGGWAAVLMNVNQSDYLESYLGSRRPDHGLHELYWRYPDTATTAEAAIALRSFLTTGDARWDLAQP